MRLKFLECLVKEEVAVNTRAERGGEPHQAWYIQSSRGIIGFHI